MSRQVFSPALKILAERLSREVIPQRSSGFTLDPRTFLEPKFRQDEFVVSMAGYELRSTLPVPATFVESWLLRAWPELQRPGRFVGGWRQDAAMFVLDVSFLVRGQNRAIRVGRQQLQECIFHPWSGKTLWLPRRERRRSA